MKLDYDIVRDILLTLEEELSIKISKGNEYYRNKPIGFKDLCLCKKLSKYDRAQILYCIIKMNEAGYIEIRKSNNSNQSNAKIIEGSEIYTNVPKVYCITFKGHEFLEKISSNKIWESIKEEATQKGISLSFESIPIIAKSVPTSLFGMPS